MLEDFYGKGDLSLDTAARGTFAVLVADANLGIVIDPIGCHVGAARWVMEEFPLHLRVRLAGLPAAAVGDLFGASLREISQQIWHRGQRERLLDGVGACVSLAHVRGGGEGYEFFVAWAGDCRAYVRRAGRIELLSQDDYDPQIFTHRPLVQFVGTGNLEPHFVAGKMRAGDSLLLCSQSVARAFSEEEMTVLWQDSAFAATQRMGQAASGALLVMQPQGTE